VRGKVFFGDNFRILNQLAPPKYTRRRGYEPSAELKGYAKYVYDINECTKNTSSSFHLMVQIKAFVFVSAINPWDVKE
jgi:hypothetical protein